MSKSSSKKAKRNTVPRRIQTHKLVWRHVTARVRHTRDYLSSGQDHIELTIIQPKDAILPITETGYRSHFIASDQLAAAGGPTQFLLEWIERESKTKRWQQTELRWRQLSLF